LKRLPIAIGTHPASTSGRPPSAAFFREQEDIHLNYLAAEAATGSGCGQPGRSGIALSSIIPSGARRLHANGTASVRSRLRS